MSYSVDLHEERDTIIITWHEDFDFKGEYSLYAEKTRALLDEQAKPFDFIFDMREVDFGMDDIISLANHTRKSEESLMKHPNMRQVVIVTESTIISMATKGMDSVPFGNVKLHVASNVDEAHEILAQSHY